MVSGGVDGDEEERKGGEGGARDSWGLVKGGGEERGGERGRCGRGEGRGKGVESNGRGMAVVGWGNVAVVCKVKMRC